LQKSEKIALNNITLLNAIAEEKPPVDTVRETFFVSQLQTFHKIQLAKKADSIIDGKYTFEVFGKTKGQK
jgi:uncharacterized protein